MLTSYLFGAAAALALGTSAHTTVTLTDDPTSTFTSSASTATSTTGPKTIEISVGAFAHKFDPESVKANVGDVIRFNFYPGGHRVARAEYKYPCIPYEYTGSNKKGFWSGVISPQVIQNPPPHYDVTVNDTDPIFFYCGAPGSCTDYGMVGVVNPTDNMTLAVQKQFANNATLQLVPGDPWPTETPRPTVSYPGTPASGETNSPEATPSSSTQNTSASGLSTGAIAGIAIGAAAVIIFGAALVYLCGRRGGFDKAYRKSVQNAGGVHGLPSPGMIESKYDDPKSPGQATMSTFSAIPHDPSNPYRVSAQSPHAMHFSGTPPPPSPGFPNGYGTYQNPAQQPLVGEVPSHAYRHGQSSPAPSHQQQFQPVELPTADHPAPAHSPPPQYQGDNRDSWAPGSDRHSKP